MAVRRSVRECTGFPHLFLLALSLAACSGGGKPEDLPRADVRAAALDLSYQSSHEGTSADLPTADPGPESECEGGSCAADEGSDGTEAVVAGTNCVDPIDWQCVDASRAQRCTLGQIEIHLCGGAEVCEVGVCMPVCPAGTANCTLDPTVGCPIDTNSDPLHCGNCFTKCGDADCVHGACVCASVTQAAANSPLDMFIMMDQSSSMDEATGSGVSKWDAISEALRAFVTDAGSAGIGVGIQYFPIITGSFIFTSESCDVADYAQAETAIKVLPGNATAIINSMAAHGPNGNTPTHPALQGAVNFARSHAMANPTHTVVVVLATDGEPTECDPQDIPTIAGVASTAAGGTPAILTFVVGVGSSLSSMDQIAFGGGTQKAFVVDQGGNVTQQFTAALQAIEGKALGCTYAIPAPNPVGQAINYEKVNVQVTLTGALPVQEGYVASPADCGATGGWYYDAPAQPNKILLCPVTCTAVTGDAKAKVDILLGCWRSDKPPDTHG